MPANNGEDWPRLTVAGCSKPAPQQTPHEQDIGKLVSMLQQAQAEVKALREQVDALQDADTLTGAHGGAKRGGGAGGASTVRAVGEARKREWP